MLSRIGNQLMQCEAPRVMNEPSKYERNELEDMTKGIELLFEFKKKLSQLHPNVLECIEQMLQRPRY